MKNTFLIVSVMSFAALATGCKPSEEKTVVETSAVSVPQADKSMPVATAASPDLQTYSFEQKSEFDANMQAKLAGLNRNFDELSVKIENSPDTVKMEARGMLAALRQQAALLNKQVEDGQSATATSWTSVKVDVQKSYTAITDGLAKARTWMTEHAAS